MLCDKRWLPLALSSFVAVTVLMQPTKLTPSPHVQWTGSSKRYHCCHINRESSYNLWQLEVFFFVNNCMVMSVHNAVNTFLTLTSIHNSVNTFLTLTSVHNAVNTFLTLTSVHNAVNIFLTLTSVHNAVNTFLTLTSIHNAVKTFLTLTSVHNAAQIYSWNWPQCFTSSNQHMLNAGRLYSVHSLQYIWPISPAPFVFKVIGVIIKSALCRYCNVHLVKTFGNRIIWVQTWGKKMIQIKNFFLVSEDLNTTTDNTAHCRCH